MNSVSDFLLQLFTELNKNKITYCVLRNYEKLPDEIGHDVDIWVKREHEQKFLRILLHTAVNTGWQIVRYAPWLRPRGQGRYFFIKNNKDFNVIHIDCYVDIHWRGINYIDEKVLCNSIYLYNKNFYVPLPGIEASTIIIPWLLRKGRIRDKDKKRIKHCLIQDPGSFLKALEKPVGKKIAKLMLDFVKTDKWDKIEKMSSLLKITLLKRALLNKPSFQLKQWQLYFLSRLKEHFFEDLGIFMVFIGPDGSGKTTIAKAILEDEEIRKLFQLKNYFHGRFSYLPELKAIVSFFNKNIKKDSNSVNFSPDEFGILRAIIYPVYYSLDYLIGHFLIRKIKAYYSIVIFDRYFYDYFIQKKYAKCPRWLLSLIAKIIPKPDLVIYLKNDPEIIYTRKEDLPMKEIKRQIDICEKLIKEIPNGFTIETSLSSEKIVEQIKKIILSKVNFKWKKSAGYKHILKILGKNEKKVIISV